MRGRTLRSSFCLLFLDGPLTVIDAFLTGPRLLRYYEQFTRVPLPPLPPIPSKIETYRPSVGEIANSFLLG